MYQHDSIKPYAGNDGSKKEQVAGMFNRIARRYDFLNHFLTAGIDRGWRRRMLKELPAGKPLRILDVATGTADVALMAARRLEPTPSQIVGIDISEGMLELGRKKIETAGLSHLVHLHTGDSEAINFPNAAFDAITVAFGVRNFANLEAGLNEMKRVLKAGGKLVVLEFSKPKTFGVKQFYDLCSRLLAPQAGKFIARDEAAYKYLHDSIRAFPEGRDFAAVLEKTGFKNVKVKPLTLGICTIYSANT